MIKYWQSMQDYKYFLTESKVHFDSSERNRFHTELWKPWQKLRLFDTDKAMEFLLPFYSNTGRSAKNQPQILRSFILFFLLYSEGLDKPSLTLWVHRLKGDRVLAALIGCTMDSLPPPGSYFDFMDRLWAAPATGLYARDKLLPSSRNSKKPDKPKGKKQKAQEAKPKITESIEKRIMDGKDIPFNFEECLQRLFYHNYPTYRLLKNRGFRAFIDLNTKCGRPKTIPDTITIDRDGTPICQDGLRMVPNGYDKRSGYLMWRCPFGKNHCTKCENSCTSSKYGRVVKTRPEWDIRLYTDVPRGTDTYKKIYNQRTATERINNRILNDYGLHRLFTHTKEHYSFMTTMIGICIHLDARYKQQVQATA